MLVSGSTRDTEMFFSVVFFLRVLLIPSSVSTLETVHWDVSSSGLCYFCAVYATIWWATSFALSVPCQSLVAVSLCLEFQNHIPFVVGSFWYPSHYILADIRLLHI